MNKKEIQATLKGGTNAIQFNIEGRIYKVWYSIAFKVYKLSLCYFADNTILLKDIELTLNNSKTTNIKIITIEG